jgi:primosomal protein N' (replication factor Y)
LRIIAPPNAPFDLVVQVCGRSGRARAGEAFIQTYSATHPAIVFAAQHDYDGFALGELARTARAQVAAVRTRAFVGVVGRNLKTVESTIERYAELLRPDGRWEVLGPVAYPLARLNDEWRYRIAVKTRDLDGLRDALRALVLPEAAKSRHTRLVVTFEA